MNEHIIQNPHQIYDFIDNTVNKILSDLDKKSENEAVQGSKERVLKIVSSFKNQTLDNAISELKKNSEWDKLVIAFYGETNAGKSTLIEALRIYLGEIVKTKNMSKFNELKQKFGGLSVEKIRKIQENKEKLDDQEKTILVSNEQNRKTLINRLRLFLISFKRFF